MARNAPTGPHTQVAERFAFLLESLELDREGFAAAVDDAVTPRSLYAILSGNRRPSRALAVLIERTFGFRADHLLDGEGPMWVRGEGDTERGSPDLTPVEQRAVDFARRSVDNARVLDDEVTRAEAWESMWSRAVELLAELERVARSQDRTDAYSQVATATLDECWAMADAFAAWSEALDHRRVTHLTRLFVQRFLDQVPRDLHERGAMYDEGADRLAERTDAVLANLADEAEELDRRIARAGDRIDSLTSAPTATLGRGDLAAELATLADSIDRRRPSRI